MTDREFLDVLKQNRLVAVVRGNSAEQVLKTVKACFEGGVKLIEITFTVPNADELIAAAKKSFKNTDTVVGAGTVLDVETAKKAVACGSDFLVSPNLDFDIMEYAKRNGIAYTPGVFSPSEVFAALKKGARVLKLFPGDVAKPQGLKALRGPFPNIEIMPTGGVDYDNLDEWFEAGAVAVGAGSNLTAEAKVGNYAGVTAEAKKWIEKIRTIFSV